MNLDHTKSQQVRCVGHFAHAIPPWTCFEWILEQQKTALSVYWATTTMCCQPTPTLSPAYLALVRLGRALCLRLLLVLRLRLLGLHVLLESLQSLGRLGIGLGVVRRRPPGLPRHTSIISSVSSRNKACKSCHVLSCHAPAVQGISILTAPLSFVARVGIKGAGSGRRCDHAKKTAAFPFQSATFSDMPK